MTLTEGSKPGRYEIRNKIDSGGMGEVYLAEYTELDSLVALKVLHADIASDDERVRRFVQEAKAASALNHPNILTVHEIGSQEDPRCIVTEYIKGETLQVSQYNDVLPRRRSGLVDRNR